jgi:hypothetical protein
MLMELSDPVSSAVEEAANLVESVIEEINEANSKQKADR